MAPPWTAAKDASFLQALPLTLRALLVKPGHTPIVGRVIHRHVLRQDSVLISVELAKIPAKEGSVLQVLPLTPRVLLDKLEHKPIVGRVVRMHVPKQERVLPLPVNVLPP